MKFHCKTLVWFTIGAKVKVMVLICRWVKNWPVHNLHPQNEFDSRLDQKEWGWTQYSISIRDTYPCLWWLMPGRECTMLVTSTNLCHWKAYTPTIKSLEQKQRGRKKEVAKHQNSRYASLIRKALDRVSPQYLHILLGIVWSSSVDSYCIPYIGQ